MKHRGSILLAATLAGNVLSCTAPHPPDGPPRTMTAPPEIATSDPAPPDRLVPVSALSVEQTSFTGLASAPITAAAMRYPAATLAAEPAAPLSLTASDGTGLRLVSLDARAVIEGPLAFTELALRFENPLDRTIEGRFAITLPEGAAISRLAMRLDTGWQEAEVVELQAARRAYEDFLHRRQDPALLEKEAGNEFRARIFPIPARGTKDIVISYSQSLAGTDAVYRLPLRGLPAIDTLRVSAMLGQHRSDGLAYRPVSMEKRGFKPDQDFEVALPEDVRGLRHQALVAARVRPAVRTGAQRIERMVVLFDTSASRAPGFARAVDQLGQLVDALGHAHGDGLALSVATFDQAITPIYDGEAGGFGRAHLDTVLARRALGASDLHAALTWAGERGGRVLVITDAIATMGPAQGDALRATVQDMRGEVERLDVILAGGIRDRAMAERLVRGTLGSDGVVLDADQPARELADRLGRTTVSGIEVAVDGAAWQWPHTLDGVQPGDEVLVFAELEDPGRLPAGKPVTITLTGPVGENGAQRVSVPVSPVAGPLLERAAARALIDRMSAERDSLGQTPEAGARREELRRQIIEMSTRHRVLSDLTGLLVLETEADYARFGIDRTALADILTVGPKGIEVLQRGAPVLLLAQPAPAPRPRSADKKEDASSRRRKAGPADMDPSAVAPAGEIEAEADEEAKSVAADDAFGEEGGVAGGVVGGVAGGVAEGMAAGAPGEVQGAPAGSGASTGRGGGDGIAARAPAAEPPPPPPPAPDQARPRRPAPAPARTRRAQAEQRIMNAEPAPRQALATTPALPQGPPPLAGKLAEVMAMIESGAREQAVVTALGWRGENPGDVMALIALGEALEALGKHALAARAYGSIIDLFPSRADMRRFAGERLERLGAHGNGLAADAYAKAVEQRPDHLTGHRLLAYALLRQGKHAEAFDAALAGLARDYPAGRFDGGDRILREDLGLIAAAWLRHEPGARSTVESRLRIAGAELATEPSLRFVLTWETDANDVDFHIHDGKGGHAYYSQRQLPSGGELYADVTTGYGPECFAIPGASRAFPYQLRIHYYRRGPMGYGMGKLEIVEHDGKGNLRFEQRPFVVMNDGAYVDLGAVKGSLPAR